MTAVTIHGDGLFPEADAYHGNPLEPDLNTPTPASIVAALTPEERVARVRFLVAQAHQIYTDSIQRHGRDREITASCLLWSGGNDSNTLAHVMRPLLTHAVMANTGIGIEQTRQFVRDQAAAWGLPLIEKSPPTSYEELVIERGFPGPAMHYKMWQRLKERCFDAARHDLGIANSTKRAAVFIAGRRRAESERREDAPIDQSDGSVIWCSPLIMWTKLDILTYRSMHPDVPRNEVSDLIHMSGECLCGAFAHPGELDEVGAWFPAMKQEIRDLEAKVRAAGHGEPWCTWGHGQGGKAKSASMCGSCASRVPGQGDLFGGTP